MERLAHLHHHVVAPVGPLAFKEQLEHMAAGAGAGAAAIGDDTGAAAVGAAPIVERRRAWFWGTLAAYAPYYLEAALSGLLVNVLTVATALYIMNVYDRVVPNNAFETLLVRAIGTATAIGFEFCAREAAQILGGASYLRGDTVERLYREVRVQAIGGGSEEIMRDLASRQLGI